MAFRTRTWGNPTTTTPATQGVCLTVEGDDDTRIDGILNGREVSMPLALFRQGPESAHLSGFVSPAVNFGRAIPTGEYRHELDLEHHSETGRRDWYHVRVRQIDGQAAWSSPIWIEPTS